MKYGLVKDGETDTQPLLQNKNNPLIYCWAEELGTLDYEDICHVCNMLVAVGGALCVITGGTTGCWCSGACMHLIVLLWM